MAKPPATDLTFPIGRFVQGSLVKPQEKDADGNPLLVKNGPNKGQPRVDFFFAVAIPKTPGIGWWQEPWGQVIWDVAVAAFGQAVAGTPGFAFKIGDGDSTTPNAKGKRPCDSEGFPGNWIVYTSSGFAPPVYGAKGPPLLPDPAVVKLGHYIQLAAKITSNESSTKPGIYINHDMVAYSGFGPEISIGRDPASANFGQGPVPAGMTSVPVQQAQFPGAGMPGPGAQAGPGGYPQPGAQGPGAAMTGPGGYAQGPGAGMPGPGAAGPGGFPGQQTAVHPNHAAMAGPGAGMPGPGAAGPGGFPAPGGAAPTATPDLNARRMGQALAAGWDINEMLKAGYTVQSLVAAGYLTPY